ncbi:MAG TPA: ROK family protein [Candidatus Coprenecus stercoravium]|uniref:ROK family protein n=1 Tax=Candidatus Coprenecus stercoravium TaxID=2840735 RepID=A0A9D2GPF8_9BACT|nr:ROK family protein [Candidatus Coprenecus stercoravium]
MTKQPLVMGIDVGGQTTKLGVVDARGNILYQSVISSLQRELSTYMDDLTTAIKDLIKKAENDGDIKGIGIGAPNGNYYKGTIEFAPNLKWAYDENGKPVVIFLANMIRDIVGIPVAVTNDANAAAVGEMTYGVAKGMKDFIMITLGTGVGSGIVIDGKIVYGHDGFAGELGHTVIVRDGRQCNCGHKGCLETYTSATGVARTAREFLAERDEPSLLRSLNPERISSKDIYDAAKQGDKLALEIFEFTGKIMGEAFADFVAFSAPEAIILFGGLAKSKEFLTEPILKSMNDNLLQMWKGKVRLLYSTLKDSDAAILGASALAWEL